MQTQYPSSILKEELKNKIAADSLGAFVCSRILGKVDYYSGVAKALAAQVAPKVYGYGLLKR